MPETINADPAVTSGNGNLNPNTNGQPDGLKNQGNTGDVITPKPKENAFEKGQKVALKKVFRKFGVESLEDLESLVTQKQQETQENEEKKTHDTELERKMKKLEKDLERLQQDNNKLQLERETLSKAAKEEKIRNLFIETLKKNNCNDPELLADSKYIKRLQLSDDLRDLDILDAKGEISADTLDEYINEIKKDKPRLFDAIKTNGNGKEYHGIVTEGKHLSSSKGISAYSQMKDAVAQKLSEVKSNKR